MALIANQPGECRIAGASATLRGGRRFLGGGFVLGFLVAFLRGFRDVPGDDLILTRHLDRDRHVDDVADFALVEFTWKLRLVDLNGAWHIFDPLRPKCYCGKRNE